MRDDGEAVLKSPAELIRLAERYVRYLREPTANPYLAWGRLGQIVRALHPTQAFDLACHILYRLPASDCRTFGTGTLAHLVRHHGPAVIDWVEREAWRDLRFFEALTDAWLVADEVDPTVLSRLRAATGARIRVVTASQRDARYKALLVRRPTSRRDRRAGYRTKPAPVVPVALGSHTEWLAEDGPPSPTVRGWLRLYVMLVQMRLGAFNLPPSRRYPRESVASVWLWWWVILKTTGARVLSVMLVVLLAFTSATPLVDLLLVAVSFLLATIGGALIGVGCALLARRLPRSSPGLAYPLGFLSLTPYAVLIALILRAENGAILLAALVGARLLGPSIGRLFRRVRAKGGYAIMWRPV